jgi:hypothetical protein
MGESLIVRSLMQQFREEFEPHVGRPCPFERRIALPKLLDRDEQGRSTYDEAYGADESDWGAVPGSEAG